MSDQQIQLMHGDCLELMALIPDNSVDLILTDPPYFRVKSEAWDRQWDNPKLFLSWLGGVLEQFERVLKPNGSLYLFASPQMAARVECEIAEKFNVVNRITWRKPPFATKAEMFRKEDLRSFFPASEAIIFAEHYGADNMAKSEAGYAAKCDELRGFVFEPLRLYLAGERDRAGFTTWRVAEQYQKKTGSRTVTGMARHWFERVQWALPTRDAYKWLRALLSVNGGHFLCREYEDLRAEYEGLRAEYEGLRVEYEDLRRPFTVSAAVPYTDVWDFKTVGTYPGKHPCEKPQALLRHIIEASSRPGALVLDAFAGTASTGIACRETGRHFIGIEKNDVYFAAAQQRVRDTHRNLFTQEATV